MFRAPLRAIRWHQTAEEFIEEILADMIEANSGVFEGLIEAELDRIRKS